MVPLLHRPGLGNQNHLKPAKLHISFNGDAASTRINVMPPSSSLCVSGDRNLDDGDEMPVILRGASLGGGVNMEKFLPAQKVE